MPVALPPGPWPDEDAAVRALIRDAFHAAYTARYSRPPPQVPIELVHARVVLRGVRDGLLAMAPGAASEAEAACTRRIVVGGEVHEVPVHRRAALAAGFSASGPALVEEAGSTLVVGPGSRFTVLRSGNILVELS